MEKIWKVKPQENIENIPKEIKDIAGNNILANLLFQRGLNSIQKIDEFLHPEKMKISSPYVFSDMKKSVDRIFEAIEKSKYNEKIQLVLAGNGPKYNKYKKFIIKNR